MLTLLTTHFNPERLREGRSPASLGTVGDPHADRDRRCGFWPCRWVRDACVVVLYISVMTMVLVSLAAAITFE